MTVRPHMGDEVVAGPTASPSSVTKMVLVEGIAVALIRNKSVPAGHLTRACAGPGCLGRHTVSSRIAFVAYSHAYALFGMFTRSLGPRPLSRWDCGLTLSCILGKPDRRIRAAVFRVGGTRACTQIIQFCASGTSAGWNYSEASALRYQLAPGGSSRRGLGSGPAGAGGGACCRGARCTREGVILKGEGWPSWSAAAGYGRGGRCPGGPCGRWHDAGFWAAAAG